MKVCFFSLGCDKNRTDSEKFIYYLLQKYNFEMTDDVDDCDCVIINTCAFIKDAKDESINLIKKLEEKKKTTKLKKIFVLGCLTKDSTIDLKKILHKEDIILPLDCYLNDLNNIVDRIGNILSFSSSLKISDGCNKNCSYCIIPKLRGNYHSNTISNLYKETKNLVDFNTVELNIVAQDILNYGVDLYHKKSIVELINKLSTLKNLKWIRLLYCYPEEIDDEFISMMKNNKKVLHYIDMPLQHINNEILRKMNRPTTKEKVIDLINKLRKEIPDIIIRTTFIVGFPGETKEQFEELIDFVKDIKFDKVGVFTYSREKGTKSYDFDDQVKENIKEERKKILLDIQKKIVIQKKKELMGKTYECLVEGFDTNKKQFVVRSFMDCREIDDVIYVKSKSNLISGNFVKIKIIKNFGMDLIGEVVE